MKREFELDPHIHPNATGIMLDGNSHDSARRAEWAARQAGLGITIFSYDDVLMQTGEEQDPIEVCARATGTQYEEQLKALFAADAPLDGQHWPNAVIAVTKYIDRVDYKKLAAVLSTFPQNRNAGSLRSHLSGLENLGIVPGRLGINQDSLGVPAPFVPPQGESFESYTDQIGSRYVIDESVGRLSRFCLLVGKKAADGLVVIDGRNEQLGNRFDAFFKAYFGGTPFAIADIVKTK